MKIECIYTDIGVYTVGYKSHKGDFIISRIYQYWDDETGIAWHILEDEKGKTRMTINTANVVAEIFEGEN